MGEIHLAVQKRTFGKLPRLSGNGACRKHCPGGAIDADSVCSERCASFISQKKGRLTEEEREILKKRHTVFGCDICQRVCPMNLKPARTALPNIFSGDIVNTVTEQNAPLLYKERAFGFRGLPPLLRNLQIYNRE